MKRLLINATIFSFMFGFSTHAADMTYPVDGNHSTPVEFGSGWYLRGDIGYNVGGRQGRGTEFITSLGESLQYNYDDAMNLRIGFGYQLNSALRFEVDLETTMESEFANVFTIGYSGGAAFTNALGDADTVFFDEFGTVVGTASGVAFTGGIGAPILGEQTFTSNYSSQNLIFHGYYDLPQMGRFKPYVGAGAGMARVTYSETRENSDCEAPTGYVCGGSVSSHETNFTDTVWKPAYSLSVGTAYAIDDKLSLDVGYSFLSVNGGEKLSYDDGTAVDFDGFTTHQVRAGLRYQIW